MTGCLRHLPRQMELPAPLEASSQELAGAGSAPVGQGRTGSTQTSHHPCCKAFWRRWESPWAPGGPSTEPQIPPAATCPQPCHLAAPHLPLAARDKTCWPHGGWKSTRSSGWAASPARHRIPTASQGLFFHAWLPRELLKGRLVWPCLPSPRQLRPHKAPSTKCPEETGQRGAAVTPSPGSTRCPRTARAQPAARLALLHRSPPIPKLQTRLELRPALPRPQHQAALTYPG